MKKSVVIIGAGAVGCLSALELVKRGWQVTLIDRGPVGGEASWAGGGILFPLLPWKYREEVNRLALAGMARYPVLCEELLQTTGIDPEYQACGMLALPEFGGESALAWCRAHEFQAEMRGDALWLPQVAQVRNPRLLRALKARLEQLGAVIHEQMELLPLPMDSGTVRQWQASSGQLFEADAFVLAAGPWSRGLIQEHAISAELKPMRGQMLLYQLPQGRLNTMLFREDFYLIPRRDGHILAGSTVEDVGFDKSITDTAAEALAAKAAALLPELRDAPLIRHWSGLRPGSPENVPVIARHPEFDNLFLNTGHFRYGVTMAPFCAELLADLLEG